MADLYAKALESERKKLWATCRLKGLPSVSAERQRIAELDRLIESHKTKATSSSLSRSDGEGDHPRIQSGDGGGVTPPPRRPKP